MSYTALYRKFRPLKFSEMVGQEHITDTLRKQVIAERVGHAYLFNGGRGTGKTSAAKILARAVNCLNPHDGEPCNECEMCKAILSGSLTDVVEMDAASNNSVEDIRAIRDEVNFLPTRAKYRVYIIDEVHMLSTGAFNALLKTLEEPPEHVKFILATTEPQKLPATILSRCQRFDFKRISNQDVIKRLKIICKESNIEITEDALRIIAVLSEGAMRDAISILERCAGEQKGLIDEDTVRDLVGIPKTMQIYSIVKAIIEENTDEVISNINSVIDEGKDIDNFLWEIIKYIKDILVYKSSKELEIYNEEEKKQIDGLSKNVSKERLLHLIYELSELANTIKWSAQKAIMFEAGMIKASLGITISAQEVNVSDTKNTSSKKEIKENHVNNTAKENVATAKMQAQPNENSTKSNEKPIQKSEQSVQGKGSVSYWGSVIDKLKQNGKMGIYVNLIGSTAKEANDMTVEVTLANKNSFGKKILETHENRAELERIVSIEAGKTMNVKFIDAEEQNKVEAKNNSIENVISDLDIPINIIND